jgi:Peroxidase
MISRMLLYSKTVKLLEFFILTTDLSPQVKLSYPKQLHFICPPQYNRKTDLTYADLYTLAGAEAISAMGGPKIPWRSGRVDSLEASDVTPDGRLPEADKGNPMATLVTLPKLNFSSSVPPLPLLFSNFDDYIII